MDRVKKAKNYTERYCMNTPHKKRKRRKKDWEQNHTAIRKTFLALLKENMRLGNMYPPTNKEIAEVVGLSESTVTKHVEGLDLSTMTERSTVKLLLEPLLTCLAQHGMKGDHNCAKLFIDKVFGEENIKRFDLTSKGEKLPETKKGGDIFIVKDGAWQDEIEKLRQELQEN